MSEIKIKFYSVYLEYPTNWGYEIENIKYFSDLKEAEEYALELYKILKEDSKDTDDDIAVIIQDEKRKLIKGWRNESGKIEEL